MPIGGIFSAANQPIGGIFFVQYFLFEEEIVRMMRVTHENCAHNEQVFSARSAANQLFELKERKSGTKKKERYTLRTYVSAHFVRYLEYAT